jgi:hypothetical protein
MGGGVDAIFWIVGGERDLEEGDCRWGGGSKKRVDDGWLLLLYKNLLSQQKNCWIFYFTNLQNSNSNFNLLCRRRNNVITSSTYIHTYVIQFIRNNFFHF